MNANQLTAGDYIAHKVTGYTAVIHNIEGENGEQTLESSDLKNWKLA